MTSFTDYLLGPDGLVPKWSRRKWGRRYFSTIATMLDAFPKAAEAAVLARFPSFAPLDALAVHSDERRLERGPAELSTTFRARLRNAFQAYGEGRSSKGMQNRLREAGFTTATVYEANDFAPVTGRSWALFSVVIFDPTLVAFTFRWGDGTRWGAGTWGGVAPLNQTTIRKLIAKWKAPYALLDGVTVVATGRPWGTFRWGDGTTWGGTAARFGA